MSVKSRILSRTIELDDSLGCKLWQGATKADGHGVMKVRFPNGMRLNRGVHQLMFFCVNHIVSQPDGLEISHLCHIPHCVNINHLVAEPHYVNLARRTCKAQGKCFNNHSPECLFPK